MIVGLCGNLLSIAVLSRKRLRWTTTSVYLRLLAVVDCSVLLVSVLRNLIYYYTVVNIKESNDIGCRIHTWISSSLIALSFWLLPTIAIDRLILVKFPVWAKTRCTRRATVVVVGILCATIFTINLHYLVTYSRSEVSIYSNITNTSIVTKVKCGPKSEFKSFHSTVWPVFVLLVYSISPLICLATCNIVLIKELAKRNLMKQAQRLHDAYKEQEQRDLRSVTKMLVVICVFFIIISAPTCLHMVIRVYVFNLKLPRDNARHLLTWSIANLMLYSNNTVNFILYCLSGSVFRKELTNMFKHAKLSIQKRINRGVYPEITIDERLTDTDVNKVGTSCMGNNTVSTALDKKCCEGSSELP